MFEDTICATATASGVGALGIIRISGKEAIVFLNTIFKGKDLTKVDSHTVHYGFIVNDKKETIDEVMVSVFHSPKTFTAENLVEITCHGSPYIQQQIIEALLKKGVRIANAGEFSQRAFLNGRIDLSQAEAVADLISAESKESHQLALNQMRGGFSTDLKLMREDLIHFVALIELELDFAEEDVEFANRSKLNSLINNILGKIEPLIESFAYGNVIKSGIHVAIVGKPNVGKSTLLNLLLNEDRAIVSNIPGTTRDTIEEKLTIEGIDFRFIDTAGIRNTADEIESLGIKKTFEKAKQAKIILYLFDKENTTKQDVLYDYNSLASQNNFILLCPTKLDKYIDFDWNDWTGFLNENIGNINFIGLSSKDKKHIEALKNRLSEYVKSLKADIGENIVVNHRHWQELTKTKEELVTSKELLELNISGDLVSFHLRNALKHLGNITGQVDIDHDILGTIFGKFCIGK
ncbi:MAG: tRNA uridine-5-carboxymethylaminomethyl(34) synthesis GTPase MnmE [Solirubrobacteraceae bacterium]